MSPVVNERSSKTNFKKYPKALNFDFGMRVLICFALIAVGTLLVRFGSWPLIIMGIVLNGMMFVHGVELQHQSLHNTGFSSRTWNRVAGTLLGIPMLVSYSAYQESHLWHHRFLGTKKDREFFDYQRSESLSFWGVVRYAFNYKRYPAVFRRLRNILTTREAFPKQQVNELSESLFIMCTLVALTSISLYLSSSLILTAWILPLLLISEPLHNLVELPEHIGCERTSRDALKNTRTIRSNWFITWFTNSNNFHVEHHRHPGVPMQLMPIVHQEISSEICFLNQTYREFFFQLIKKSKCSSNPSAHSRAWEKA